MKFIVRYSLLFLSVILLLSSCIARKNLRIADTSFKIGEYYQAIEKYKKAYKSQKLGVEKTQMAYKIAECYYAISEFGPASIWYKNAIKRKLDEPKAMLHYADCLLATQKYDEARTWYLTYLDIFPEDQKALNGLEAAKTVSSWLDKPTRYIVNPVRELNSKANDYSPVYIGSRDNEVIFTSTRDNVTGKRESAITGQHFADLFKSSFLVQKQKWETPKLLDESLSINTLNEEGAASVTSSGDQMVFTRCRYSKSEDLGAELYMCSRTRGDWSEPVKIELAGDSIIVAHPALSPDGSHLYFVSDMRGGQGGKDIWVAEKNGGTYSKPVNLGPEINTPGDEMFPTVRKNGDLYFSSNYRVGIGGLDIFHAHKDENGKWVVENMKAPINSPGDDFGITFTSGDEERGLFSSNRKGARLDDIYSFYLPPKVFTASGEVYNKETDQKIDGAQIRVIGTDGTNMKVRANGGRFQMKLNPGVEYVFAAFKDGFLNDKERASTIGLEDSKDFKFEFHLTPTDTPIKIDNINYEFGSSQLSEASKTSLDSLARLLEQNPTITIELMSHTDHVGSEQFNFELSQKRAQSVVDYLISKGIPADRLVAKGYGETWPKKITRAIAKQYDWLKRGDELTEEFISKLTPEQQEIAKGLNRRTEFRILSTDYHESFAPDVAK